MSTKKLQPENEQKKPLIDPTKYASSDQIAEWKEKYGEVFEIEAGDEVVYLRTVRRNEMGLAHKSAKGNPMLFTEHLLKGAWIHGDKDKCFKDEAILNSLVEQMEEIIPHVETRLKKL